MTQFLGKIVADFQTQLATAIAVGGTSATLQSATDDDSVALPSGRYFFTIDGDNTSKEHISCELAGTSLTSIKTVTRQGTESSGVARKHRVGATVTITNFKHIKAINDLLDGTTDFDASTPLKYDGTATISDDDALATKAYVDGVAIAGAADASTSVKGISKMSTAPASASNPIAVGDNDPRVPTADENDALAGTSGSPSTSNKYVTEDDVADDGTASKVLRLDANSQATIAETPTSSTHAASKSYVEATAVKKISIDTSTTDVYSTTSETDLISFSVPAGTLGTGNALKVRAPIQIKIASSSSTALIFRLKYGSTTIATINGDSGSASAYTFNGFLEAYISAAGTTSTQIGDMLWNVTQTTMDTLAFANSASGYSSTAYSRGTASEDSTGDLDLKITVQPAFSSSAMGASVYGYIAHKIS